jgi:hypothetical protein
MCSCSRRTYVVVITKIAISPPLIYMSLSIYTSLSACTQHTCVAPLPPSMIRPVRYSSITAENWPAQLGGRDRGVQLDRKCGIRVYVHVCLPVYRSVSASGGRKPSTATDRSAFVLRAISAYVVWHSSSKGDSRNQKEFRSRTCYVLLLD